MYFNTQHVSMTKPLSLHLCSFLYYYPVVQWYCVLLECAVVQCQTWIYWIYIIQAYLDCYSFFTLGLTQLLVMWYLILCMHVVFHWSITFHLSLSLSLARISGFDALKSFSLPYSFENKLPLSSEPSNKYNWRST